MIIEFKKRSFKVIKLRNSQKIKQKDKRIIGKEFTQRISLEG